MREEDRIKPISDSLTRLEADPLVFIAATPSTSGVERGVHSFPGPQGVFSSHYVAKDSSPYKCLFI